MDDDRTHCKDASLAPHFISSIEIQRLFSFMATGGRQGEWRIKKHCFLFPRGGVMDDDRTHGRDASQAHQI